MTLSNLFGTGSPATYTFYTNSNLTDQVITSSPAILVHTESVENCDVTLKSGGSIVSKFEFNYQHCYDYNYGGRGVSCPSGITITTLKGYTNSAAIIHYNLV